jgi:hypothetical protein
MKGYIISFGTERNSIFIPDNERIALDLLDKIEPVVLKRNFVGNLEEVKYLNVPVTIYHFDDFFIKPAEPDPYKQREKLLAHKQKLESELETISKELQAL